MRRRTRLSLLVAAVVLCALIIAVILRKKAPPECARLLPESDAIVYLNLKPLRLATHFERNPVEHDPTYQKFIDATGFVFERDLDEAAFSLHRMADPKGPNGPVAFSEVFTGRIDGKRLTQYLSGIATAKESYDGHEIFTIPIEDEENPKAKRLLRVAMLSYDMVAASNTPTTEQIHSILDRYRSSASPFSGSSLLAERYADVPLLSAAWGIGKVGLPFSEGNRIQVLGLTLPLAADTTFVASLRYVHTLHLRIEEIAGSDAAAANSAATLQSLLNIFRTIEEAHPAGPAAPEDAAFQQMIASLKIEQEKDRAVLTGTLPIDLMKKIATPAHSMMSPEPAAR